MNEIEKLEKRKAQLDARIKMKKAKYNQAKRKRDTKRKVLVGAGVLLLLKSGKLKQEVFNKLMNASLSNKDKKWLVENPPFQSKKKDIKGG